MRAYFTEISAVLVRTSGNPNSDRKQVQPEALPSRKLRSGTATTTRCVEPTQPHSNGSLSGPSDVRRFAVAVEALNNLIYLASRDAENPESVRIYLKLAEERVASLTQMLRRKSA
jgi:hypothetical protein